jgi:hypothetical protein
MAHQTQVVESQLPGLDMLHPLAGMAQAMEQSLRGGGRVKAVAAGILAAPRSASGANRGHRGIHDPQAG